MKTLPNFILVIFLLISGCKTNHNNTIEGTWELVSADWIVTDTIKFPNSKSDREIKIIGKKNFLFIRQDTSNSDMFFSGGGIYSFKDSTFTETMEFSKWKGEIGHSVTYKCKFEDNLWIMTGPIDENGEVIKGWQLYEKWRRIDD